MLQLLHLDVSKIDQRLQGFSSYLVRHASPSPLCPLPFLPFSPSRRYNPSLSSTWSLAALQMGHKAEAWYDAGDGAASVHGLLHGMNAGGTR